MKHFFKNTVSQAAIAAFLVGSTAGIAQAQVASDGTDNRLKLNIGLGVSGYAGEFNKKTRLGDYELGAAINLGFEYAATPNIGIRADVGYNNLSGTEPNDYMTGRNRVKPLDFKSTLFDVSASGVFYFRSRNHLDQFFTPYGVIGIGLASFNAKTKDGVEYGTFYKSAPSKVAAMIPFGIGFLFRVQDNINIGIEGNLRYTFTDYIDGLGNNDVKAADLTPAGEAYFNSKAAAGSQNDFQAAAGNLNDGFGTALVRLQYTFGKKKPAPAPVAPPKPAAAVTPPPAPVTPPPAPVTPPAAVTPPPAPVTPPAPAVVEKEETTTVTKTTKTTKTKAKPAKKGKKAAYKATAAAGSAEAERRAAIAEAAKNAPDSDIDEATLQDAHSPAPIVVTDANGKTHTLTAAERQIVVQEPRYGFNNIGLSPVSAGQLDRVITLLNKYPGTKLVIESHTDNVGSDEVNIETAKMRAGFAVDYLTQNGIDDSRILTKSFGESQPRYSNETAEGRAKNRRLEFRIVK